MNVNSNPSQSYTLPSRSKSPPHDQNLSKSMPTPTHFETDRMKKASVQQWLIVHTAISCKYDN